MRSRRSRASRLTPSRSQDAGPRRANRPPRSAVPSSSGNGARHGVLSGQANFFSVKKLHIADCPIVASLVVEQEQGVPDRPQQPQRADERRAVESAESVEPLHEVIARKGRDRRQVAAHYPELTGAIRERFRQETQLKVEVRFRECCERLERQLVEMKRSGVALTRRSVEAQFGMILREERFRQILDAHRGSNNAVGGEGGIEPSGRCPPNVLAMRLELRRSSSSAGRFSRTSWPLRGCRASCL